MLIMIYISVSLIIIHNYCFMLYLICFMLTYFHFSTFNFQFHLFFSALLILNDNSIKSILA